MDKRFVGRWQSITERGTIDIFDEEPPRMKMSFSDSGCYNFYPNTCYFDGEMFCYEINDEENRRIYRMKYVDGRLCGEYTEFGRKTKAEYELADAVPHDEPERYDPPDNSSIIYVPDTGEKRIDVLRRFAAYDRNAHYDIRNEYILGGSLPPELEDYGYSDYIAGYDGDELAIRLLQFVTNKFRHNGRIGMAYGSRAQDMLAFLREKGAINCRGLAILLASLLRMNGFRARHITCMPYEEPFDDCHVVVDCELKSGRRIMFDPSWGVYLRDEDGGYVSLPDVRQAIIEDKKLTANPDANYNGEPFELSEWIDYMTKNCFRFERGTLAADGVDGFTENNRLIELIPAGYPVDGFTEAQREKIVYNDLEFWKM